MGRKSRNKKIRRQGEYTPGHGHSKPEIGKAPENIASSKNTSGQNSGLALVLLKVIKWGAYVSLFAPLIVSSEFFFPFVVPKTVFFWVLSEIIFSAWIVLALSNKQFRPRWNFVTFAVFLFLAVTTITSFLGVNTERSFWSTFERMAGTVNWIHLSFYFLALSSTFKAKEDWKGLIRVSLIVSTLVCFIFLLPKVSEGFSIISFDTKGGSTIGNSSFMAAYILFNIFLSVWLVLNEKEIWRKSFYSVGLSINIFTILISTAYGALVSMFGGFFIIIVAWLFFERRVPFGRPLSISLLLFGALATLVIAWGTFTQNEAVISKLPYFFSREGTIGARKVVWEMAWQGVKERPIFGWGPENFNVVFAKYFNPCLPLPKCGNEIWFDRTHNIILDHLINSGVMGLVSYLLIYAAVGYTVFRYWIFDAGKLSGHRVKPPDNAGEISNNIQHESYGRKRIDWLFPAVITAVLSSYFVQNFLVFDMINTYLMFIVTIAFVSGMSGFKESEKSFGSDKVFALKPLFAPTPIAFTLSIILLLYGIFSFGVQSLQAAHWGLIINVANMPTDQRLDLYRKSLSISPLDNRQIPEFFTNRIIQSLKSGQSPSAEFIVEVVGIMEKISSENPMDYREKLILGTLYSFSNKYDPSYIEKAEKTLIEAIGLSPDNQQGYSALAQVYILKNDYDKAIELLEKSASLEPRYVSSHLHLAGVYKAAAKYEEARIEFEKALSLGYDPKNIEEFETFSQIFEQLKEYERAAFWHSKILEQKSDEPKYYLKSAELYEKAGKKGEAEKLREIAKKLEAGS